MTDWRHTVWLRERLPMGVAVTHQLGVLMPVPSAAASAVLRPIQSVSPFLIDRRRPASVSADFTGLARIALRKYLSSAGS
jgi:hypothetical protein